MNGELKSTANSMRDQIEHMIRAFKEEEADVNCDTWRRRMTNRLDYLRKKIDEVSKDSKSYDRKMSNLARKKVKETEKLRKKVVMMPGAPAPATTAEEITSTAGAEDMKRTMKRIDIE